jgi:hypothetical protein
MGWHCILQFTIYDIDNIFNKMQVVSPNFRLIPFGTWITVLFLDILYLAIKIMLFYILMSYLHYLCLLAYSGVQHILCCFFASFVFVLCLVYDGIQHVLYCVSWFICLRPVSCVWWHPTRIVLCFLVYLSSSCVLCMMASNTYCIVFLGLFVFVLCLVYPILPVSPDCPFLIAPSVPLTIFCQ